MQKDFTTTDMEELRSPGGKPRKKWRDSIAVNLHRFGTKENTHLTMETAIFYEALDSIASPQNGAPKTPEIKNITLEEHLANYGLGKRWLHILNRQGIKSMEDLYENLRFQGVVNSLQRRVEDNIEGEALSRLIQDLPHPVEDMPDPKLQSELQRLSLAGVNQENEYLVPKNHCLRLYIHNAGLDSVKYSEIFAAEGISTLSEIQHLLNDKGKFNQAFHNISETEKVTLQKALEKTLNDAVHQEEILNKLGLIQYFPEKISMHDVMKKSVRKVRELHDIPWFVLSKILMLDHRGRDDMLPGNLDNDAESGSYENQTTKTSDETLDDMFAELSVDTSQSSYASVIHPTDVLVTVFQCSSNLLRQSICDKLFMCKLSIPLIWRQFFSCKHMFLLWSLRNIILEYKLPTGEFCESSLASCYTSVVTCMRIGNIARSKSKFLNEILNGQSHDTFLHRDCKNGMIDRKLSKGVIEIALYLPSAKESTVDQFNEVVTLANSRGDGRVFSENAIFLQKFTNVFLVMVDVSEIDKPDVITSLKMLMSSGAELVLMISKASGVKFDEKIKLAIKNSVKHLESQNFKGENIILDFTFAGDKNIKLLRDEVVGKINKLLEKKSQRFTLTDFKALAESLSMSVDENSPECIKSFKMASEIIEDIKNSNVLQKKSQKLPLQSKSWQKWAKLNKEEKRLYKKDSMKSVDEYVANLHSKKIAQRKEQLKYLENPHNFLVLFIERLGKTKEHERIYFMKWLKLHLDELSRKTLPGLQKKYSQKMDEISQVDNNLETIRELQEELSSLIKDIAEASFGVEHLMREIGQAYEAVVDMSDKVKHVTNLNIKCLPKIMAELMLFGYPLELMDGDASHVPLLWVNAVLKELKFMTGDAKIFVLSVLGIQSSGKSTMLNTMFGLQFPVAAGRCTRGVYAQLVPTNKGSDNTYDYILVVDTEGLRAPELGHGKLQHDNEIATLVVGLGDVTLVNIKGENVAELEEVLQIVVHAILKMRLVNDSMKLQPSCIFIHQNVGAADAGQKMKIGQQKLVDTLDKVTQAAGEQEDAPEFCKFHQVIDFDIKEHIRYISDLWKGDPPMASVNPGYSDKVNSIKEMLLNDTMKHRGAHLTVSKLLLRTEDLWKGILGQNFVFSFKNSIAMRIYSSLEKKISDLSWSLGDNALKWLNKASNMILKHEREFDVLERNMVKQLDAQLKDVYDQTKAELERFFEEHEEKDVVEQWRANSLLKLSEVYEETLRKTRKRLKDTVNTRRTQTDPLRDTKKYKETIINNSRKLVDDLRLVEDFSEEILERIFNKHWDEWMTHLPEETATVQADIYNSVMNALITEFHQDQALLFKILEKQHAQRIQQNFSDGLKNHIRMQVPQPTGKKNKRVSLMSMGKAFRNQTPTARKQFPQEVSIAPENSRREAQKRFEKLQEKVKSEINKKKVIESKHANSIINLVLDTVNEMSSSGVEFVSKARFTVDMAVFACQLASFEKSKSLKSKKQTSQDATDETCIIKDIKVSPIFKEALCHAFPENQEFLRESLTKCCTALHRNIGDFDVDVDRHITRDKNFLLHKKTNIENCRNAVVRHVENMTKVFKSFFDDAEIQTFRDEYVSAIFRKVNKEIESAGMSKEKFKFTKTFRMEMTGHVCMFAIPVFHQKHKRYMDSLDPRTLFEKNNKETCLIIFKNLYYKRRNEKALAESLSEKICKAIQSTVERDMPRKLADEVRCNVQEVRNKATLLPAVLNELLNEDSFEDYLLLLKNIDGCFDKWIRVFVNNYLFQEEEETGHTQYMMIASSDINDLLEKVCEDIDKTTELTLGKGHTDDVLLYWIRELQKGAIAILPIIENELLSLAKNYDTLDLSSLTAALKTELEDAHEKLYETFSKHDEMHLSNAYDESVYALIAQGCKGCTAKCPFCNAPCSLSSEDHVHRNIKHRALEHYPLACGGMRWVDTKQLLTENCSVLVAGDLDFHNEDTDYEAHPYKEYKALYKDWEIDGDATVEASPYWKWFLLHHAPQLTEKFEAELPDIPEAWQNITVDMARNSLYK